MSSLISQNQLHHSNQDLRLTVLWTLSRGGHLGGGLTTTLAVCGSHALRDESGDSVLDIGCLSLSTGCLTSYLTTSKVDQPEQAFSLIFQLHRVVKSI